MEIFKMKSAHQFSRDELPVSMKDRSYSVAVGNFDGLHKGHQKVIEKALRIAGRANLSAGVLTFYPHPQVVLGKVKYPSYLTPLPDKLQRLEKMGVEAVFVIEFTPSFSKLTPEQFIEQIIVGLHIKEIVTGFDFRFGQKGKGTTQTLETWAQKTSAFNVHTLSSIDYEEGKISSSRIRQLLGEGRVDEVFPLLNRYYACAGEVIHGQKRGRTIGFPTANLQLHHPYVLPKEGVYAARVKWKDYVCHGVLNLGRKPTFENKDVQPGLEVHLFEVDQDLYGETLYVEFVSYLRSEKKFDSVTQLKEQIGHDVAKAKQQLGLDKGNHI